MTIPKASTRATSPRSPTTPTATISSAGALNSRSEPSAKAILAGGTKQGISYVGKFNFNWMTNYIYADDAAPVLPKGTIVHVVAWHDNTKANKFNPDSDQWVGYGDRTVDEMAHAWINVTYLNDDEYKALVAERKAKAAKTTNNDEKQQ